MKKLLFLFTTLLFISCSSDDSIDGEEKNVDDIIGTWKLTDYNRTYFEDDIAYTYPCLTLGSNDFIFDSDGTGIIYLTSCEPLLDNENPTVDIDNEIIHTDERRNNFLWENRNGVYFGRGVNSDGTITEWTDLKLDIVSETILKREFDNGEAQGTYQKQ
jgi:hypothetical protein